MFVVLVLISPLAQLIPSPRSRARSPAARSSAHWTHERGTRPAATVPLLDGELPLLHPQRRAVRTRQMAPCRSPELTCCAVSHSQPPSSRPGTPRPPLSSHLILSSCRPTRRLNKPHQQAAQRPHSRHQRLARTPSRSKSTSPPVRPRFPSSPSPAVHTPPARPHLLREVLREPARRRSELGLSRCEEARRAARVGTTRACRSPSTSPTRTASASFSFDAQDDGQSGDVRDGDDVDEDEGEQFTMPGLAAFADASSSPTRSASARRTAWRSPTAGGGSSSRSARSSSSAPTPNARQRSAPSSVVDDVDGHEAARLKGQAAQRASASMLLSLSLASLSSREALILGNRTQNGTERSPSASTRRTASREHTTTELSARHRSSASLRSSVPLGLGLARFLLARGPLVHVHAFRDERRVATAALHPAELVRIGASSAFSTSRRACP